jgi:hypothetical protein
MSKYLLWLYCSRATSCITKLATFRSRRWRISQWCCSLQTSSGFVNNMRAVLSSRTFSLTSLGSCETFRWILNIWLRSRT